MYVDLGPERLLAAERGAEKIAVEIQGFVGRSTLTELHNALGQYQIYLAVLEKIEPERRLFLALSKTTFEELAAMETFELVIERFGIASLAFHIAEEVVAQWKT